MRICLAILTLLLLTGCGSLIPSEHKEQVAVKTAGSLAAQQSAQVTKQLENVMPPQTVTVSGASNSVTIMPAPSRSTTTATFNGEQSADASDSALGNRERSIPMGVKIAMLGGGLILLLIALKMIMTYVKSTAAGAAAVQAGDRAIASAIDHVTTFVSTETDPTKQAQMLSLKASLEKQRGQFNAKP